jgi:hypothetical protein
MPHDICGKPYLEVLQDAHLLPHNNFGTLITMDHLPSLILWPSEDGLNLVLNSIKEIQHFAERESIKTIMLDHLYIQILIKNIITKYLAQRAEHLSRNLFPEEYMDILMINEFDWNKAYFIWSALMPNRQKGSLYATKHYMLQIL